MTGRLHKAFAAVAAIATLVSMAACGSSGKQGSDSADDVVTFGLGEPQNPLIPGNTNESNGSLVVNTMLYTGLVTTKPDGTLINEVADKIEPNADSSEFDITLQSGWKFSDGTPVTSESFTKAWSYTANAANAQLNSSFMSVIAGYDDLQKDGLKGDEQLSGLTVVDDTHFKVKLNAPCSIFPTMLVYMGFDPLPEGFYSDPKGYGEKPVGNGPYKFKAWSHNSSIDLVPNEYYKGYYKPKNGGVHYKIYTDTKAQYADVQGGNLDVMNQLPATALKNLLKDKSIKAISKPGPNRIMLGIPTDLEHFSGEEGTLRRQAISKAIDRQTICDKIMSGLASPAQDFSSPTINGFSDSLKGNDVLTFDAAEAKKLWAEADKISPWSGTFTISYNADGSSLRETYEAVANQLKNTLGIDVKTNAIPTKQEYLTALKDDTLHTAYNDNWGPDYPSLENYLKPIYSTAAYKGGSNYDKYLNPEFDALLDKAAAASSTDEANKLYQQAEEILLNDLPSVPIYNVNALGATSKDIDDVQFNWQGNPVLAFIAKG
ncbi:peptide ABC transporter substrate-binding protein [Bifidobacterium aerophilum]|uniref:ABC transporter substrate-binding protein n=1 Tax=Bifidobacterium aerophilum TaxID=1798155 RepID=A0A6N9Z5A2_9BIFI|nr:ABC transporter substrate-binding protein [Bifidobacterium aerophilum]NEG89887.1 ABC transporter substrate-binding protein [Bifidobacterium aerophilum]